MYPITVSHVLYSLHYNLSFTHSLRHLQICEFLHSAYTYSVSKALAFLTLVDTARDIIKYKAPKRMILLVA